MATTPKFRVKHSSKLTISDMGTKNKQNAKMRALFMKAGWTLEKAMASYPDVTLEKYTSRPGFYILLRGSVYGPHDTEQDAQDAGSEMAYEIGHG